MNRISQREMRNDSAAILRRVAAGESFVVTNGGKDAAMLLPIMTSPREQMIATGELTAATEGFDPAGWEMVETDGDSEHVLQGASGDAVVLVYLDTSAILRSIAPNEPHHAAVLQWFVASSAASFAASDLTVTELQRYCSLTGINPRIPLQRLTGVNLISVSKTLLKDAADIPHPAAPWTGARVQLRTLDAIHIAAATKVGADGFLSYDQHQSLAASQHWQGFAMHHPGLPDRWYESQPGGREPVARGPT